VPLPPPIQASRVPRPAAIRAPRLNRVIQAHHRSPAIQGHRRNKAAMPGGNLAPEGTRAPLPNRGAMQGRRPAINRGGIQGRRLNNREVIQGCRLNNREVIQEHRRNSRGILGPGPPTSREGAINRGHPRARLILRLHSGSTRWTRTGAAKSRPRNCSRPWSTVTGPSSARRPAG